MMKKWLLPSLQTAAAAPGGMWISWLSERQWDVHQVCSGAAWWAEDADLKLFFSKCFHQFYSACIVDETFKCCIAGLTAHRNLIPTSCMPLQLSLWTPWLDWSWGIKVRLLNPYVSSAECLQLPLLGANTGAVQCRKSKPFVGIHRIT